MRVRVLVVEDNRDAADTLRMLLELEGHEVTVTYRGDDGLRAALAAPPDVVVSDIGLPGLDGYALARALRASPRTASVRLVAVTGYGQQHDRRRALDAGFDAWLVKPVEPADLLAALSG